MAPEKSVVLSPLSEWQVNTLRLTAFYRCENDFSLSNWWESLMGKEPETSAQKRKDNMENQEGLYKDGSLILTKSPVALDLRFTLSGDRIPNYIEGVPTIGTFDKLQEDFVRICEKFFALESLPLINRLAYGAIVNMPTKDRSTGYSRLSKYIPCVTIDTANSRDFIYRVNRRRPSAVKIEGLMINRLNKWCVVCYQTQNLAPGIVTPSTLRYACQLELDISTCQELQGDLPEDKQPAILNELVAMSTEIVEKGDVK